MKLRSIILAISIFIIALSLSLYFQASEENVQSMSWDQYKNLSYREERTHTLEEVNQQLKPFALEELIDKIRDKNRLTGQRTRVMELGAGNGRALMTLKKMFPDVEFYGVNQEKTRTFYRRESYGLTALKFGIFTEKELEEIDLPYIVFQNLDYGRKIAYGDEKFDLVFSLSKLNLIKYKVELLNETLRILKVGGITLHSDLEGVNIYSDGVHLERKEAFHKLKRRGLDIRTLDYPTSILIRKTERNQRIPLTPQVPIPAVRPDEDNPRTEMNYNLEI